MTDNMTSVTTVPDTIISPNELDASMIALIRADLTRAEIGLFSMLRAGLGLLVAKDWNPHGTWEHRMAEIAGPNRAPRTLQRYMRQARDLCQERGIAPLDAWEDARQIDVSKVNVLMLQAPSQHLLHAESATTDNPDADGQPALQNHFTQMLFAYVDLQSERKKTRNPAEPKPPLTAKEKADAAVDKAFQVIMTLTDWLADGTWGLLSDEELESAMSAIRTVADKLRDDYRRRLSRS